MLQLLPLLTVDLRGNLGDSIDGEDEEDNDDVSSGGADDDIVDYSDVKHLHGTLRYEMTEVAFRKLLAVCCDQRVLVFPVEPKIKKNPLESSISDLEEGLQGFFCYRLLRETFHFFTLPHHIDKIQKRKHNFLFKSHVVYSCKFVPQVQIKFHYVCSLSLQN